VDKPDFSEADTACFGTGHPSGLESGAKFRRHTVFGYPQLGERLLNTIRRVIEARIFGFVSQSGVASQALPPPPQRSEVFSDEVAP